MHYEENDVNKIQTCNLRKWYIKYTAASGVGYEINLDEVSPMIPSKKTYQNRLTSLNFFTMKKGVSIKLSVWWCVYQWMCDSTI
jgi:hypothetical protein